MITPLLPVLSYRQGLHRKEPLVQQLFGSFWIFSFNCIIKEHTVITGSQIPFVKVSHPFHLRFQLRQNRFRNRHCSILLPLAVNRQDSGIEIEISHPELQTLEQTKTATEQHLHNQAIRVIEVLNDRVDLLPAQDRRDIERFLGPRYPVEDAKVPLRSEEHTSELQSQR